MDKELCDHCEYNDRCKISYNEKTEACKIACRWPNRCKCGETTGVKIVCLTDATCVTTFPICKKCFRVQYYDLASQWDDVCLPNYSEEGKIIILSTETIIRNHIEKGNINLARRIMQNQIDKIKSELKIAFELKYLHSWEIRNVIKRMRKERRIKVV